MGKKRVDMTAWDRLEEQMQDVLQTVMEIDDEELFEAFHLFDGTAVDVWTRLQKKRIV